jgi:hypothetical protein
MQKHIKTHKTWQSCCSLDSLASKSEGPSGHGDAGTLAPQGHLETRSTVSRTWICLPALQKYVHTSISTIMLCIYILLLLYIYSYYPPIWSYPKYHQLSNFLGKIGALMMSPKSKVVFDTAFQAIQTGENGLGCHHQKKKWNLFCFKTRLPLRFKCLN